MQISVKKLPESKMEISVTLPWDEWKKEMEHAIAHLTKDVKLPGFRPGKAPRAAVERHFGKQAVLLEAAEHAIRHSYPSVLEQEKIEAIGEPEVKLGKFAEHETLEYTVITAVLPAVVLKPWQAAVREVNALFSKRAAAVEESEIDAELERLASMRAKLVTVNREARLGDNVLVDFTVLQDGVVIEHGQSEKHPLVLGQGVFIPGFEEKLLGMQAGEEKIFELTFPAKYHAKHLAGQPATFKVKMSVVQEREVPTIDDAFAAGLGNFTSLEQLKENMRQGLFEEKKKKTQEEHRTHILDALVEKATIEHPQILVAEELRRMLREFEAQVQSMGLNFTEYLAQMKKTPEDMQKDWEPQAKKRLSAHMILDTLAKEEDISVDTAEIEAAMNQTLGQYQSVNELEKKIDMERLYSATRGQLLNEKVLEFLETLK